MQIMLQGISSLQIYVESKYRKRILIIYFYYIILNL